MIPVIGRVQRAWPVRRSVAEKPFAEAMVKLEKGQYSGTPVKSDFGYHVIQVEDRRKAPPPAFEELANFE